jgi:hypothetical protein
MLPLTTNTPVIPGACPWPDRAIFRPRANMARTGESAGPRRRISLGKYPLHRKLRKDRT